jgi:hypothetical protein
MSFRQRVSGRDDIRYVRRRVAWPVCAERLTKPILVPAVTAYNRARDSLDRHALRGTLGIKVAFTIE